MLQMRRSRPSALAKGTVRAYTWRQAGGRTEARLLPSISAAARPRPQSERVSFHQSAAVACLLLRRDGEPTPATAPSRLPAGRDEAARGHVPQCHPLHPRVPPPDQGGGDGPAALLGAPRAARLDAGAGHPQGLAAAPGPAHGAGQQEEFARPGQVAPAAHRTHPHQEGFHLQVADPGARQRHYSQGFFRKVRPLDKTTFWCSKAEKALVCGSIFCLTKLAI